MRIWKNPFNLTCAAAWCSLLAVAVGTSGAQPPAVMRPIKTIPTEPSAKGSTAPVVTALAIHPREPWLAIGGDDHSVSVWHLHSATPLFTLDGPTDWIRCVEFSPSGDLLAAAGDDGRVFFWELPLENGKTTGQEVLNADHCIYSISFSPDGALLSANGFDVRMQLIDAKTRETISELSCPCRDMRCLTYSPDGLHLAGAGRNGKIRIWRNKDNGIAHQWKASSRRIRSLCFSPSGSLLAVADDGGATRLWDWQQETEFATLQAAAHRVYAMCFYDDNYLAAGCSDNRIHLWNVAEKRQIAELQGHEGTVAALAYDPHKKVLISGGFDTTIRFWDLEVRSRTSGTARNPNAQLIQ